MALSNPQQKRPQVIPPTDDRWARLRNHKRIISRVKLQVEWEDGSEKQHANAVTVDVSHSGCMAVVGADLHLHQRVNLIHPESGRKVPAEVVWRSHEAWDAGFALDKPDASFWGLKL
jgi:PilZ domain